MTSSRRALLRPLVVLALAGAGCTRSSDDASVSAGSANADGTALCGALGEACCDAPNLPCGVQLGCDEALGVCVLEQTDTPRLCRSSSDCAADQTCCLAGNFGTCQLLGPEATCALPDLELPRNALNLSPFLDSAFATAGVSATAQWTTTLPGAANSCALEKQCLPAAGVRYKLLRFSTQVVNIGTGDLILGPPGTPGVQLGACDGLPYLENFLLYELLDARRARVAMGHGRGAVTCLSSTVVRRLVGEDFLPGYAADAAAPETTERFSCEFLGLPASSSLTYDSAADCQWVEIGSVRPGDYLLRITVNPDLVLTESPRSNNILELPVTLPAPLDPVAPCPVPRDPMVLSFSEQRDCGWSPTPAAACTPGQPVQFGCLRCEGAPLLRICEGRSPCTADEALAYAQNTPLAEPAGAASDATNRCPSTHFTCPPSGVYNALVGVYDPRQANAYAVCDTGPMPSGDAPAE